MKWTGSVCQNPTSILIKFREDISPGEHVLVSVTSGWMASKPPKLIYMSPFMERITKSNTIKSVSYMTEDTAADMENLKR